LPVPTEACNSMPYLRTHPNAEWPHDYTDSRQVSLDRFAKNKLSCNYLNFKEKFLQDIQLTPRGFWHMPCSIECE
jgi:hypothetical protein